MMHPRTEMIDGLDDILDSDRVFVSDAPSDRDDPRLGIFFFFFFFLGESAAQIRASGRQSFGTYILFPT